MLAPEDSASQPLSDQRYGLDRASMLKTVRVAAFRGDPEAVLEVMQQLQVSVGGNQNRPQNSTWG